MEQSLHPAGPNAIDLLRELKIQAGIEKANAKLGEGKEHLLPYIQAQCTNIVSLIETTLELEGVQEHDPLTAASVEEIRQHIGFLGFTAQKNARKLHEAYETDTQMAA